MANPYKVLVTKVAAQNKLLRANERSMVRARLQMQCACVHKDANGAISLNSPQGGPNGRKSKITGAPLYVCRECYREIDVSPISQSDLDTALDTINRVIDISKIRLDVKTDRDRELLSQIANLQFENNDLIPNLYNVIVKTGNKGKKKQRSQYADTVRISR